MRGGPGTLNRSRDREWKPVLGPDKRWERLSFWADFEGRIQEHLYLERMWAVTKIDLNNAEGGRGTFPTMAEGAGCRGDEVGRSGDGF